MQEPDSVLTRQHFPRLPSHLFILLCNTSGQLISRDSVGRGMLPLEPATAGDGDEFVAPPTSPKASLVESKAQAGEARPLCRADSRRGCVGKGEGGGGGKEQASKQASQPVSSF